MMLLKKGTNVIAIAPIITFGVYDESFEKWRLADEEDNIMYYMIDDSFELVEGVEIPIDYEEGKYFFENGKFVLNEDWKPYVSPEERIAILEEKLSGLGGEDVWEELANAIQEGVNDV